MGNINQKYAVLRDRITAVQVQWNHSAPAQLCHKGEFSHCKTTEQGVHLPAGARTVFLCRILFTVDLSSSSNQITGNHFKSGHMDSLQLQIMNSSRNSAVALDHKTD